MKNQDTPRTASDGSAAHREARQDASEAEKRRRFQEIVMPHFDAAYNLARWMTRNVHDAEDVTHEAFVRAMTFFDGFRGGDARAWVLTIVRNTCHTYLQRNRAHCDEPFDEALHDRSDAPAGSGWPRAPSDPEALLLRKARAQIVNAALRRVPSDAREVLILRELEELSYKEIADIVHVPLGTVMSRLHRARRLLREALQQLGEERPPPRRTRRKCAAGAPLSPAAAGTSNG